MITLVIPHLHLGRGENEREHPFVKAKRVRSERGMVFYAFYEAKARGRLPPMAPPFWVRITRLAPGTLDSDNLVSACKQVRDQTAIGLGLVKRDKRGREVAMDGPNDPIRFKYWQELSPDYQVRIEVGDREWWLAVQDINSLQAA